MEEMDVVTAVDEAEEEGGITLDAEEAEAAVAAVWSNKKNARWCPDRIAGMCQGKSPDKNVPEDPNKCATM